MDPWTGIGWIVLITVSGLIVTRFWAYAGKALEAYRFIKLHVKTQDIEPAEGQAWKQPFGSIYNIEKVTEFQVLYRFVSKEYPSTPYSLSVSPEKWKEMVQEKRLFLLPKISII